MGIVGSGCGCHPGCDLTLFGGPNCGSGVLGDCSHQIMSVDILVTSGCTLTVNATMSPRSGCPYSGADGNSQSNDRLKVDVVGGSKNFQTGSSNASISDSYTLIGPGVIRVSGAANRADEIITYSVTYSNCSDCILALPIELVSFDGYHNYENGYNELKWSTASESNNDRFDIYSSNDGENWSLIGSIDGAGSSNTLINYNFNHRPESNITYYQLKQTDYDGQYEYSNIISVNKKDDILSVKYYDLTGRELQEEPNSGIYIKLTIGEFKTEYERIFKLN
jgi:hypothetical protein